MTLEIERMNHTGDGIGKKDGIIYFVKKTIPGDIVNINEKDIIHHKNYNEVERYELIKKSIDRIESECPYYQECGGCQIMNLPYEKQLEYKKEKIINIFKRYASLNIDPSIIPTSKYNYRNKITLQVKNGMMGLYSEKTNKIIEIDKCLLIPDILNNSLSTIKKLNLKEITNIILKVLNQKIMIQFIGNISKEEVINLLSKHVSSIYINNKLVYGDESLIESLSPYKFYVSPNSFFQVNHEGTILLYDKIKEFLGTGNKEVLDLYCGTGTIGIYVSKICQNITGIELSISSVNDAKKNIKLNNINNMKVIQGDVGKVLKNEKKYDAIIVDPPRIGLDKITRETLKKIKAPKIIYVSCNPITLARDINDLKEIYNIKKIELLDMFPNTYHCESVCILERR